MRETFMPYQAHPSFTEPEPGTARLWRYMDLAQFLLILEKEELFFPSVATLAEADPYEGEPLPAKFRAAQAGGPDDLRTFRVHCEIFKHLNFYNSWHMNDDESDAMWKLYLKGSQGIAIQSTVERVKASFQNTVTHTVYMALVEYIDYENFMPTSMPFGSSDYMYKRRAFRHEQEVRIGTYNFDVRPEFVDNAGFIKVPKPSVTVADMLLYPDRKGVYVPVNISALIERVVVYPLASVWFSDLVMALCKRLGYAFEVVPSEMGRPSRLSLA
jgi:hypothetical protein